MEILTRSKENGRKTDFWLFVVSLLSPITCLFLYFSVGLLLSTGFLSHFVALPYSWWLLFIFVSLFAAFLLWFSKISFVSAVESFATYQIEQPYLILSKYGVARFGRGIKRNLFLDWSNINFIELAGPKHSPSDIVRLWIKTPTEAWRNNKPIFLIWNKLLMLLSDYFRKPNFEYRFVNVQPHELSMTGEQFIRLVNDKMKIVSDGQYDNSKWKKFDCRELHWTTNLVYLLPFAFLFLGWAFAPIAPSMQITEVTKGQDFELLVKVLSVWAFGALLMSFAAGFLRICRKILSPRRVTKKVRYKNKLIFVMSLTALFYLQHLDRPHYSARLGFVSFEEMRKARKEGIRTGEKWRAYLETK